MMMMMEMMRKGKEDAAAHKTDDFGISIFILFCFSFCERVSESSKELRRYFLDNNIFCVGNFDDFKDQRT